MNWYEIINADSIDSPALVVYKERIHENIRLLKSMVHGAVDRLRPHVKTNKTAEVCRMMMEAGITKFKCATIAEAEMLAMEGAQDVLLAYQPVGPKILRFARLVLQYPSTAFSCLVDNIGIARQLSVLFTEKKLTASVYIDLNTGMNRTGVPVSQAVLLFEALQLLPAIRVTGLHAYDGHVRDTAIELRTEHAASAYSKLLIVAATIESITDAKMTIVTGGSPTFPIHAKQPGIECSPGTFIFWDWGYRQAFPDEPFQFAALVLTRVVSVVNETTISTDLGHKSVAAENPLPRVHFLNAPDCIPYAQSEEHLVLKVADASLYPPGFLLYGVPVHICPTVALYQTAMVVENNSAGGEWKVIAANRRITI